MSFTNEIKQEICSTELQQEDIAQLSAIMKLLGTINLNNNGMFITVENENIIIARRIVKLLKYFFHLNVEIAAIKNMKFGKKNIYSIRIFEKVDVLLKELQLKDQTGFLQHPHLSFLKNDLLIRQYLAGIFLSTGSINSPENTNYHLEFRLNSEESADFAIQLLKKIYIDAKMILRRDNYIVYVKASEQIGDFLRAICASNSLMKFEDMRIRRDFKNSITRLDNCATANDMKTYRTGVQQIEIIELLQQNGTYNDLDDKLKEVAQLRLKYPEDSLHDLVILYEEEYGRKISKSGIAHRFRKLKELAKKEKN